MTKSLTPSHVAHQHFLLQVVLLCLGHWQCQYPQVRSTASCKLHTKVRGSVGIARSQLPCCWTYTSPYTSVSLVIPQEGHPGPTLGEYRREDLFYGFIRFPQGYVQLLQLLSDVNPNQRHYSNSYNQAMSWPGACGRAWLQTLP